MNDLHPARHLFGAEKPFPTIPVCEHIAGRERFIEKAFALNATLPVPFDITCDLEDGAPVGNEEAHLLKVTALMKAAPVTVKRLGLRIHAIGQPVWRQEIAQAMQQIGARLSYITVPKVRLRSEIEQVQQEIQQQTVALGLATPPKLHVLIETHAALRDIWDIAATTNLEVLDFGIMDFISEHHGAIPSYCMRSPGQFEHALLRRAKSEIVAAAIAHGVVPAHNVTTEYGDTKLVAADARRAHEEFGFLRMWSIHPSQIEPIVHAMSPSHAEVARATEILSAGYAAAWGPTTVAGILHDRASYRFFWDLLARAAACGVALPSEAQKFILGRLTGGSSIGR